VGRGRGILKRAGGDKQETKCQIDVDVMIDGTKNQFQERREPPLEMTLFVTSQGGKIGLCSRCAGLLKRKVRVKLLLKDVSKMGVAGKRLKRRTQGAKKNESRRQLNVHFDLWPEAKRQRIGSEKGSKEPSCQRLAARDDVSDVY